MFTINTFVSVNTNLPTHSRGAVCDIKRESIFSPMYHHVLIDLGIYPNVLGWRDRNQVDYIPAITTGYHYRERMLTAGERPQGIDHPIPFVRNINDGPSPKLINDAVSYSTPRQRGELYNNADIQDNIYQQYSEQVSKQNYINKDDSETVIKHLMSFNGYSEDDARAIVEVLQSNVNHHDEVQELSEPLAEYFTDEQKQSYIKTKDWNRQIAHSGYIGRHMLYHYKNMAHWRSVGTVIPNNTKWSAPFNNVYKYHIVDLGVKPSPFFKVASPAFQVKRKKLNVKAYNIFKVREANRRTYHDIKGIVFRADGSGYKQRKPNNNAGQWVYTFTKDGSLRKTRLSDLDKPKVKRTRANNSKLAKLQAKYNK